MPITTIQTELTTSITDGMLAIAGLYGVVALRRLRAGDAFKVALWTWVLGLFSLAALLGAIAHGMTMSEALLGWIWQTVYLALGLVVSLFVVGALRDGFGPVKARRALPPMLCLGVGFYLVSRLVGGDFRIFLVYEGLGMLFALVIYLKLALVEHIQGAALMVVAVLANVLAAALQASGVGFTLIWPFDRNGAFHLAEMVGIAFLIAGLQVGLDSRLSPGIKK